MLNFLDLRQNNSVYINYYGIGITTVNRFIEYLCKYVPTYSFYVFRFIIISVLKFHFSLINSKVAVAKNNFPLNLN